jgi:endogenous inhibitor of DNA gyrase (YacG/DUF329 family)
MSDFKNVNESDEKGILKYFSRMVQCPLCGKSVSREESDVHANNCLDGINEMTTEMAKSKTPAKRKMDSGLDGTIVKQKTNAMECPVCGKAVPLAIINDHVNICLEKS